MTFGVASSARHFLHVGLQQGDAWDSRHWLSAVAAGPAATRSARQSRRAGGVDISHAISSRLAHCRRIPARHSRAPPSRPRHSYRFSSAIMSRAGRCLFLPKSRRRSFYARPMLFGHAISAASPHSPLIRADFLCAADTRQYFRLLPRLLGRRLTRHRGLHCTPR